MNQLIILFIFSAHTQATSIYQKTQNLGYDCRDKPENYCSSHVPNSICNYEKNECFCRKGFMAIKERNVVACKTILTDLKCRVDSNCIHVNGSSCHPGTGYCSCPSSTIYVPELHECKMQITNSFHAKCNSCKNLQGICYSFDYERGSKNNLNNHENRIKIGCVCNEEVLRNYPDSAEESLIKICGKHLSDIDEYCNNEQYVCRSKIAQCIQDPMTKQVKTDYPTTYPGPVRVEGICKCPRNHVGIYQKNLKYHECFPILSEDVSGCKKCNEVGGKCYDSNNDQKPDGCLCPNYLSNKFSEQDLQLESPCSMKHLFLQCNRDNLLMCYKPHWMEPYENLPLLLFGPNASATVTLRSQDGLNHDVCDLRPTDSIKKSLLASNMTIGQIPNDISYCRRIDLINDTEGIFKTCGIRRTLVKNQRVLLELNIDVKMNQDSSGNSRQLKIFHRLPTDLNLQASCIVLISKENKNVLMDNGNVKKNSLANDSNVALRVINEDMEQIRTVRIGSMIQLEIEASSKLDDEIGHVRVNWCKANNNTSLNNAINLTNDKCSSKQFNSDLSPIKNFYSLKDYPNRVRSNEFPAFQLGEMSSMFFTCQINLCQINQENCNNDCWRKANTDKMITLEKMVHVEIFKNNQINDTESICRFAVCLTSSQISLVTCLLVILFLLVSLLIVFIHKKSFKTKISVPLLSNEHLNRNNHSNNSKLIMQSRGPELTLINHSPNKQCFTSSSSHNYDLFQHGNTATIYSPKIIPFHPQSSNSSFSLQNQTIALQSGLHPTILTCQQGPLVNQTLGRPRNLSLLLNNSSHNTHKNSLENISEYKSFDSFGFQNIFSNSLESKDYVNKVEYENQTKNKPKKHMFMQMNNDQLKRIDDDILLSKDLTGSKEFETGQVYRLFET